MSLKWILFAVIAVSNLFVSSPSHAQRLVQVGTIATAAPLSFLDAKTNTYRGMSVDIIREIAKDAGFEIQFTPLTVAEMIPALNDKKIDLIAANLVITPERMKLVDFSEPFHRGPGEALIVPKSDTKDYRTLEELRGAVIGAVKGSPQHGIVVKSGLFSEVKEYATLGDVLREINSGAVPAVMVGGTFARYQELQGNLANARRVTTFESPPTRGDAFSVRKGDTELLRTINASLAKLQANGTVKKILASYGF